MAYLPGVSQASHQVTAVFRPFFLSIHFGHQISHHGINVLDQNKSTTHDWQWFEIQKYISPNYCIYGEIADGLLSFYQHDGNPVSKQQAERYHNAHLTLGFLGILGTILGTFCLGRGATKLSSSVIKRGWKLIRK